MCAYVLLWSLKFTLCFTYCLPYHEPFVDIYSKKSYIILIVSNICRIFKYYVACEEGYTGQNCEIVCPFPSYGLDCQSICNCAETTCDHVNGCRGYSSGIYCYNCMSQYAVFLVLSMICKGYWTVIEH